MRKTYRISVYNQSANCRELMWERFTSIKKAQEMADKMNDVDKNKIVNARVFVELR